MTSNARGARNRSTVVIASKVDNSWKDLPYWKVNDADIKDCQDCIQKGRRPYPISPAVGYCRRCKLDG